MGSVVPFRRPAHAQSLIKHTATLSWLDRQGEQRRERHAAWTSVEAAQMAWKRARSLRLCGEALTFRIDHRSQVVL
ncbi:hypothetical protein HNP32_001697 [Brevundimonas bullata]|jgi:hypothetical protein|uniref:Uncharacterized protein n=1 Tax=Brevundimonas bullata TaxID=13160 RepID=A0A7W7N328_9CAUL|nr:hypothetical protein [Brevundimonas bullata]MBB4797973.1 hypothetical protein [Brevundimonas bullata]MBB6382932.1 hypothetical protein [Brevundimonas bullata]MBD3833805.1 hypothetical protein [Brevundimonas sp.]